MRYFHVTSSLNRASITAHGLDWDRMGAAPGIAGSPVPEQEGCFLGTDWDAEFFIRINNTDGPVDVWEVVEISDDELVTSPEGFSYLPRRIPASQLRLVRREVPAPERH